MILKNKKIKGKIKVESNELYSCGACIYILTEDIKS